MSAPEPERFSGAGAGTALALTQRDQATDRAPKRFIRQQIPDNILHNEQLVKAIKVLPANYNFEVMKTVWRLREASAKRVAMQFPEGLLMYACAISDILEAFAGVEHTFIMGDVTYGACCVDDYGAAAIGADFLVHYGHSCLVPVSHTKVPCMYVFVDIQVDFQHLIDTVRLNFQPEQRIMLAGTIQFTSTVQSAKRELEQDGWHNITIPQEKPLSAGETLGCTAPRISADADVLVFVADGRFHLEAMMIANPSLPAYRYDPYGRVLTREKYDQRGMRDVRRAAVERAQSAQSWGLILGTLGRQGNPATLERLQALLEQRSLKFTVVLLSEVTPTKLAMMPDIDAWIQVACPRLSIDWGEAFLKPTLTPYEAMVCLGEVPPWWESGCDKLKDEIEPYPMDYYARDGGDWNGSYHKPAVRGARPRPGRPHVPPVAVA